MHTVTFDNDLGFAIHNEVAEALNVDTYFTSPYASQDKGTFENRIRQIKCFFPKKTDLSLISDAQVNGVEQLLYDRSGRKFNYLPLIKCCNKKLHLLLELR